MLSQIRFSSSLLLFALLLSGCSIFTPTKIPPTVQAQTATTVPYPAVFLPSETAQPSTTPLSPGIPSPTIVLTTIPPTATATNRPSPVLPTFTQASANTQTVLVFLIAVGDNGQSGQLIGCGDSVVPVEVQIPPTQGVLRAALQALLGIKQRDYGESGLYNSLYQSDLKLKSVAIQDGKATIYLTGTLTLGGECDNPRVEAQITATARQFYTVKTVAVFINDKPLAEVLSLK